MECGDRRRDHQGAFYMEFEDLLVRCFAPVQTKKGPAIVIRKDWCEHWERWFREEPLGIPQEGGGPK